MDAFFQYVYVDKYGAANLVDSLREDAEYLVCNLLMKKGLNFVYQEDFAYLVDEKLWDKFWDCGNELGLGNGLSATFFYIHAFHSLTLST